MPDLLEIRREFLETGVVAAGVRPMVFEAWQRCRAYGIDPHSLAPQKADPEALKRVRDAHREVLEKSRPFLDQLHEAMGDKTHVLALSDERGCLLHLGIQGVPPEVRAAANGFEGASWHERDVGCNGIGTSLAVGKPLVLIGPEHFEDLYTDWTCIGIPLRGADKAIVGALGLFVPNEFAETKAWGWTLANAAEIEANLATGSNKVRPLPVGERDKAFNSLRGIMELLLPALDLLPTHSRFIEEARRAVMAVLSEREWTHEILRVNEERFQTLANMIPQIVWSTTPDGYHDYFNERWYEFTGMPEEEDFGWNWEKYLHPDDRQRAVDVWERSLATGERYEVQYRVRRASDGAYRWFIARAMPIRDREGAVTRWFGTCTDIDEQRREEEKLEALVAERTARLEEQTARLRNLAAELGSAEQRERRRLAALLHDDLQQVLVAAKMKINTLHRHIPDKGALRAVEQAAFWVDEAVGTARDLSRELRPPALYEGGLAAALRWFASEMEERHHLKVEIDAREIPESISDDIKALLFECIRELLFNAAKHSGTDRASVSIWKERGRLRVAVSDEGRGFDVSLLSGAGHRNAFGLFSIRERLVALDGELTIESAPGKGTRIDLEVPLGEEAEPLVPASLIPVKGRHRRGTAMTTDPRVRVVVVDDHATVREGIAAILDGDSRLNVVGQAADGVEAIESAERQQPDVMLIDLNMPRMNGIEATREIIHRWPEMTVVGLSVQDDETTRQSMLNAGAAAFLPKAGDSDHLVASILDLAAHDRESA